MLYLILLSGEGLHVHHLAPRTLYIFFLKKCGYGF